MEKKKYGAIVMGASAGGMGTMQQILPRLGKDFQIPICIVQHIGKTDDNYLVTHFQQCCALEVKEASDKEKITAGTIYFAPSDYHLLVAEDKTLALSVDEKVNFSRPSIDVLFQTASEAYCSDLIGIVLTGANSDGAQGMKTIAENGGLSIVQSPKTAAVGIMPTAAIMATEVDYVLPLDEIAPFLTSLEFSGNK